MTRRKIREEEKREAISISVPKVVKQAAIDSGNASRFFEQAAAAFMEKKARRIRKNQPRVSDKDDATADNHVSLDEILTRLPTTKSFNLSKKDQREIAHEVNRLGKKKAQT